MARPSKYPPELRDRSVWMVVESWQDHTHEAAAIRSVASKLGITSTESSRPWLRQAEIDGGARQGKTSEEIAEVKALRKEVTELRRANEIYRTQSAVFAPAGDARAGLVVRRRSDMHDLQLYELTDGQELQPVVDALSRWASDCSNHPAPVCPSRSNG